MGIRFNKPHVTGSETTYINEAINKGYLSGNGQFTKKSQQFFENRYGFSKCLLTTSCTDALEMSALLIEIKPGDEVIIPSYTFVSTALAFVRQGARVVFCDSRNDHPGIDEKKIEPLITEKTKAIIVVHYAGVASDMDLILSIAAKYNLFIIEDAAQAVDSHYKGKPLGSIGHLGCFSFHETKNIQSGEGGMLVINDSRFEKRSEILWEKGTNRAEFFRGEVNKYSWVDVGSSFLPSDIIAAFLYSQLENINDIQKTRITIWETYYTLLKPLADNGYFSLPNIPDYAENNGHMFYILCNNIDDRTNLISHLKTKNISAVFHYLSLHKSPFYKSKYNGPDLLNSDIYSDRLLRLPFFYSLTKQEIISIVSEIKHFFKK